MSTQPNDPNRPVVDRAAWDIFARHQPFYHICTDPSLRNPDEAEQASFWKSGDDGMNQIQTFGHLSYRDGTGVDFGCGMGRLTRAMRALTSKQIGLDISPEMLARARQQNEAFPSMEFRLIDEGRWPVQSESCELAISVIVFQHLSTEALMEQAITEFGRVLKPGGKAVFQIITRTRKGDLWRRLRERMGMLPGEARAGSAELMGKIKASANDPSIVFSEREIEEMIALDFRRMKSILKPRLFRVLRRSRLEVYAFERAKTGSTWVAAEKR